MTSEFDTLVGSLNAQRGHVLGILDGLDHEALRRPVLPSGWNCLGLVQHLAIDVERFWFRSVAGGDAAAIDGLITSDMWQVPPDADPAAILDLYRHEIDLADEVLANVAPDSPLAWWPDDMFGSWQLDDLRGVVLHVIAETACHAGHLDAVRELIDGRRWMVLSATGLPV